MRFCVGHFYRTASKPEAGDRYIFPKIITQVSAIFGAVNANDHLTRKLLHGVYFFLRASNSKLVEIFHANGELKLISIFVGATVDLYP